MHFLRRFSPLPLPLRRHFYSPPSPAEYATPSSRFPRDAGLDHVILREKNLKPLINLKNLLKSEPSKSLPISVISASRPSLLLPIRSIDFVRRYPRVFEEFLPPGGVVQPHVRLTKEALELDAEEELVYESVEYKQDLADRLLRFLMIGRRNGVGLSVLRGLKWELGLPEKFEEVLVPDFPDYFVVNKGVLELVCWIDELAVSAMEMVWLANEAAKGKGKGKDGGKGSGKGGKGGRRGGDGGKEEEKVQAFQFPVKYSTGFEMDKDYKAWLDEWQKLPCDSPYKAETSKVKLSEEFDKRAVAVLHEVLNLFVGMKGEKEIVLCVGQDLGMRGRFRKALLQHPGIFYVSSKNRMYTVILKDGYKRGTIIKTNPLSEMRFKYLDIMRNEEDDDKETEPKKKKGKPKNKNKDEGEAQENDGSNVREDSDESDESFESFESDKEEDEEVSGLSNEEGDSEEDDEQDGYRNDNANRRGRFSNETKFSGNRISRGVERSSARAISSEAMGERSPRSYRNNDYKGENSSQRFNRKNDYKGENSSSWSNKKNDYKGEHSSARPRGSSYVARQGRGAERENNMSGERQFNRQWRGAERGNNMSGERQFNRQRRGADRENNMSRERPFTRQRRGGERENNMSGERQFNQQRKQRA